MKTLRIIAAAILTSVCLSGCKTREQAKAAPESDTHSSGNIAAVLDEERQSLDLASRIHENMTFDQVAMIIPLSQTNRSPTVEHGGVWYNVPTLGNYFIQLRFEHPSEGKTYNKCKLNLPPRVKAW